MQNSYEKIVISNVWFKFINITFLFRKTEIYENVYFRWSKCELQLGFVGFHKDNNKRPTGPNGH